MGLLFDCTLPTPRTRDGRACQDVNWVGSEGDTPLVAACRNGHTPTALCLLDNGAEVNTAAVTDGQTALHLACRKGNEAVAEALIQKGAHLSAVDHRGKICRLARDTLTNLSSRTTFLPFALGYRLL